MNRNHYSQRLPVPIIENYEWQYEGECNNHDPEIFFLPYGARMSDKRKRIQEAKKICGTCVVVEKCLTFAIETEQEFGVWGGLSEEERRVIIRRKNPSGTIRKA